MKIDDVVFVFDPKRQSIYECKIKNIIRGKDGKDFVYVLTPTNPYLSEVTLSHNNVFETFVEAFKKSIE